LLNCSRCSESPKSPACRMITPPVPLIAVNQIRVNQKAASCARFLRVSSLLQLVLIANAVILAVVLVLAIPGWFILRDVKNTAERFGLVLDPAQVTGQKEDAYLNAARTVFRDDPAVAAFIYGHTHMPSVRRIDGRAVINTGTWIKQFQPVSVRFGVLPRIFVPRYCLSSFRITADHECIVITYREVKKAPVRELTWLQHILMSRRVHACEDGVPRTTVLTDM